MSLLLGLTDSFPVGRMYRPTAQEDFCPRVSSSAMFVKLLHVYDIELLVYRGIIGRLQFLGVSDWEGN